MSTRNFFSTVANMFQESARQSHGEDRRNAQPFNTQEHTMSNNNIPSANNYTRPRQNQYNDRYSDRGGQNYIIVNGRRIPYDGYISGNEIIRSAGGRPGRRVVKTGGGRVQSIDPSKNYAAHELVNKYGDPIKVKTMPDRTKGHALFGSSSLFSGTRSRESKQIITEQVFDVVEKLLRQPIDFDEHNANWVVIPKFHLPRNWSQPSAPLMILFPTDYPALPPIGFYLPNDVQSPHGHKYTQAYHGAANAPLQEGWDWYCCTVDKGSWCPAPPHARRGWRDGDNLWDYITLINEVLGNDE